MKPSEIARLARQMGAAPDPWTRRQFLRATLAGGAGLFLSGQTGFGQRRRPGSRTTDRERRQMVRSTC